MELVDAFSIVGLVFLLKKGVDLVRLVKAGIYNEALELTAYLALGVGVIWLAAGSQAFAGIDIGGILLNDLDWQAKLILGLTLGGSAASVLDNQKAKDDSDTAKMPPLFPKTMNRSPKNAL